MIECRDVFEAVYYNVKAIMLASLDSVKVKSKTVSETAEQDENNSKCTLTDPTTETQVSEIKSTEAATETVRESIEREDATSAEIRIRKDLQERFPYAMAAACSTLSELDEEYRRWKGEAAGESTSGVYIPLSANFPLSDRFVNSVVLYVSSVFLVGVNDTAGERFFGKYTDSVSHIAAQIPWECRSIAQKYRLW